MKQTLKFRKIYHLFHASCLVLLEFDYGTADFRDFRVDPIMIFFCTYWCLEELFSSTGPSDVNCWKTSSDRIIASRQKVLTKNYTSLAKYQLGNLI